MWSRFREKSSLRNAVCLLSALVRLSAGAPDGYAAESSLAPTLCGVLKRLVPEVRTFRPEGAQAQLVMALADAFDSDAVKLRQVTAEIDAVTSSSCPNDRASLLTILHMQSLREAIR